MIVQGTARKGIGVFRRNVFVGRTLEKDDSGKAGAERGILPLAGDCAR